MAPDFTYIDDIVHGSLLALDKTVQRIFAPMQAGDVRSTAADIQATIRDLGWQPTTSIDAGLPRLADWVRRYWRY